MKQVNVLSMYELNKYMKAVAQEAGMSLQASDKEYSYIKGKTIYLAAEPMPIDADRAVRNLRRLLHEMGHHFYSDFEYWNSVPLKQTSPLRSVWNMIEDQRGEFLQSQEYQGDADILDVGTAADMKLASRNLDEVNSKPAASKEEQEYINLRAAMLKFDRDMRNEWQPSTVDVDYKLTKDQEAILKKLRPFEEDIRRVRKLRDKAEGTRAAHELAKRIYTELGGDVKKEEEEGQEEAKKGNGRGHGDQPIDGSGKESKPGAPKSGTEAQMEDIGKRLSTSPEERGMPTGAKGGYGSGKVTPALPEEFFVVNYANPHKGTQTRDVNSVCSSHALGYGDRTAREVKSIRDSHSSSEQLAVKMRRLVQIRTRSRTIYGQKQGKLHGASLYRIAANVPGYSERVFKQKQEHLDIDSAVCVCIDMSGSMGGAKIAHAVAAAEMLSETVGNALGIPLMIYGFSEGAPLRPTLDESPTIFVLRDFTERMVATEVLRDRAKQAVEHTMGNNPDGDAVIWGFHQLRSAKGKRKILFVLSDGSPATGRRGDQDAYLKQVCAEIEKTPIKLFGLGLMDVSVKRYYKRNAVVENAAEIEPKIIELVDNFILEGK